MKSSLARTVKDEPCNPISTLPRLPLSVFSPRGPFASALPAIAPVKDPSQGKAKKDRKGVKERMEDNCF